MSEAPPARMRAAVLHGRGDLRVEQVAVPVAGPGEVLLRVTTAGLCGTDAAEFGTGPHMFPIEQRHPVTGHEGPMTIGHEFAGQVVAVGNGVDESWCGRSVASCGSIACGRCWQCERGRTNLCESYVSVGLHRPGALAEYVTTPLANCASVDELGLPPDAAALGQPMSIAVHARGRGRLLPGERAVVLGAGGIGAFLVHAAAALGADVLAVDVAPERLRLAVQLGARQALPADTEPGALVAAAGGPPHVVYEATGRPEGLDLALRMLPAGGRLVLVGLHKAPAELDLRRIALQELELIGTNAMVRATDFEEALRLVARRSTGWGDVAPKVVPLEDVAGVLGALAEGRSPAVKVLVDPRIRAPRDGDTHPRRRLE